VSTVVFVGGTGTEVGKTWVGAALLRTLRTRGVAVHARKPVQSFAQDDACTDASVLASATGEAVERVCPRHRWYPVPLAPPMAARELAHPPFTIADLAAETAVAPEGVTLVEGAGGLRSPLADDGDNLALIAALDPALVILVADAGLGTINAVRLSADALRPRPVVVYLNRFTRAIDVHLRNLDWLRERDGDDVVTDVDALTKQVVRRARL